MPTFPKPTPTALIDFAVRLSVTEADPAPIVAITFSAMLIDDTGAPLARPAGDLAPYLTPAQVSALTNAALALYAKAKAEFLT